MRSTKENFADADIEDVLEKIAALPMQYWNYKTQDASIRHIGPVAQDFHAAFDLGEDDLHLNSIDMDGVNMAAIQALAKRTHELRAKNATLEARIAQLEALLVKPK